MPLTPWPANETPGAEELGDETGEKQQHAALSVTARSWQTAQRLKGFSERSSFD